MFAKFEQNVSSTIQFIKLLGIKVNNETVDDLLQNHPDWPSLLCISDSLNSLNIPNAAGQIESSEIDILPTPFMAYIRMPEEVLCVIKELSENQITYYSPKKEKIISENKEEFIKKWSGIYLMAEKTEDSGEKDYTEVKRKKRLGRLLPYTLLMLIVTTAFYLVMSRCNSSIGLSVWGVSVQYIILLSGVFVSVLLLWHEIDNSNPLLKKVCTGISKGNCDAILNSNQSKVFSWLSWSEVGFFYFAGGLLTMLFLNTFNEALALTAYLNLLALPYTVFSIYYQAKVAKQWCVLCLIVQLLLVVGAVNVLLNGFLIYFYEIPLSVYFSAVIFYLFPILIWYSAKPQLLKTQEAKNTKRAYLRVKFNSEVFDTLLKKQKKIAAPTDGLGIDIGNHEAANQLIKVCNPYCGPCSKAHLKIEKLLDEIPSLKVKIIFTTPDAIDSETYKATAYLLDLSSKAREEKKIK